MGRRRLTVVSHVFVARDGGRWLAKNRVAQIIDALAECGWRVTVVAREGGRAPFLTDPLPASVDVIALGSRGRGSLAAARAVGRSDAVLAFHPSLLGAVSGIYAGSRAVLYAGNSWAQLAGSSRWRVALETLAARRALHVLAAGDAVCERFRRVTDAASPCVPIVPEEVARRLRTEVPAAERAAAPLRVLFVGSVAREKGARELVAALSELGNAVECRVVGNPIDEELVQQLRSLPNAEVLGYCEWDVLRREYEWADVLALPSYAEGFPRVAYEAAAYGAALVVTPVGGLPHRLADGASALLVPPGDAEALARALRRLVDEPDLKVELANGAVAALAPVFADPHPAAQFDRLLRRVVSGAEAGDVALGGARS